MRNIIISIIIILILSFSGYELLTTYKPIKDILKKENKVSLKNELGLDKYKNYEIVRCSLGLYNLDYVFVGDGRSIDEDDSNLEVTFYNLNRKSIFSSKWESDLVGNSIIKNTTFPQLLSMVKDDCYQFQKSKGDRNDEVINWSYGKYKPKKPKTKEEIEEERRIEQQIIEDIKNGKAQPTVDDIEWLEFIEKKWSK